MNKSNRILQTLLILLITSITLTAQCSAAEDPKKPLAIGFGENERYILYSNGEIHKLLSGNQTIKHSRIDFTSSEAEPAIIDFEIYEQNLYLYQYTSLTATSGKTTITIYNLTNGEKAFTKTYKFTVIQENQTQKVTGEMVQAASACSKGFALIKANTTHALIEAYRLEQGKIKLKATYGGRMAMTLHRYGDTIIAATYKIEYKNNTLWPTPQITDLLENKTILELPSLVPVAAMAYPFIQIFNKNGLWESYVSVYNPTMKRMEYYLAYPKNFYELEGPAKVSPYIDYLILDQKTASKITFKNGQNITLNQKLSIIPQGAHIPLDPKDGILDANPTNKTLLAKTVQGDKAKILLITEKTTKEIYTLNAEKASKTEGFYAALTQNTAYIIDPEKNKILAIQLENQEKTDAWPTATLAIAISSATIVAAITAIVIIRRKAKLKQAKSEKSKAKASKIKP